MRGSRKKFVYGREKRAGENSIQALYYLCVFRHHTRVTFNLGSSQETAPPTVRRNNAHFSS